MNDFIVNDYVEIEVWEPGVVFQGVGKVVSVENDVVRVGHVTARKVDVDPKLIDRYPVADAVIGLAGNLLEFRMRGLEENESLAGYPFPTHGENATYDAGDFEVSCRVVVSQRFPLGMDPDLMKAMRTWFDARWGDSPSAEPFEEIRSMFREVLVQRWQDKKNSIVDVK